MKWRAALELDPGNSFARDSLTKLGLTNLPTATPLARAGPFVGGSITKSNQDRLKIISKLDSIRLESVAYDDLPLAQVLYTEPPRTNSIPTQEPPLK